MARKTYNDEFKIAAKLVRDQGYSIKMAAQSPGVDQGSIRARVRTHAPALMPPTPDASPEQLHRENLRLREENRRLLMGREILEKATASAPRGSGEEESFDSKPLIGTLRVTNPAR